MAFRREVEGDGSGRGEWVNVLLKGVRGDRFVVQGDKPVNVEGE